MLLYLLSVYKNQKKQYHFLFVILTILSAFEFSFLAMYDAFTYFNFGSYEKIAINALPTLPAFIALTLSVFVTKYFIISRKQEFSILLLSGRKPKDLFKYLIIQFGLLTGLSYVIGIPLGMGIIALMNRVIDYAAYSFHLNYHFSTICFYNFWFLFCNLVIILAVGAHQFVMLDKNIADHISTKYSMSSPAYQIKMSAVHEKRKVPYFSIFITIIMTVVMITSISKLISPDISTLELVTSFTYALAGEVFIVNTVMPLVYDIFHNSYLLKHPLLMNSLAAFNDYAKTMVTLMNLNACIIPTMLFLLFFSTFRYLTQVVIVACFIMTIIMICLCFLLRFSIYAQNQKKSISTLYAIGYSSKRLNQISIIKNTIFFILVIVLPFLFLAELLWKAYHESLMSINVIIIIALCYACLYMGMTIYILIKEKQIQKEVMTNVKYSHRSS